MIYIFQFSLLSKQNANSGPRRDEATPLAGISRADAVARGRAVDHDEAGARLSREAKT